MKLDALGRVGVFSRGVARIPRLGTFLGCRELIVSPSARQVRSLDAVAGWGHKPSARVARDFARRHGLPYLALEDGFLRSVAGGADEPPLSLVLDDQGIYYDAGTPSRLELLLEQDEQLATDTVALERAERLRERVLATAVSKYNQGHDELPAELRDGDPYVLVVDQTFGDASVALGLGSAEAFQRMLSAALDENPGARVIVKVHPDTLAGRKRGYLAQLPAGPRVTLFAGDVAPQRMLSRSLRVYTCTSQLGFDALLGGVPVTCFGAPFYSGWGLTDDRVPLPRRTRRRSLGELVAAALFHYPRYVEPISGEACQAETVLEHLALQRERLAANRRRFACFGFSLWKQPFVRRYLAAPGGEVRFLRSPRQLRGDADVTIVTWASRTKPSLLQWAEQQRVSLWRMEDGFLRSVGLGSDLAAPGSLVLDRRGIYYDPRQPSELEVLLQEASFSAAELTRAAALRHAILSAGISKYNASGSAAGLELGPAGKRRVLLVVGQVEDDASVRLGGTGSVKSNQALLQAVRAGNPDAFVVYKPHPDVVSGNRRGALAADSAKLWDQLVESVPLPACLAVVHEVHTLTSLVGFEALLRGLPVFTYGQPFYAGWGLTTDHAPFERRKRRLTLDELVAGTLLRYPRYYSWQARCFCTPEQLVEQLTRERARGGAAGPHLLRKARNLLISLAEWRSARG